MLKVIYMIKHKKIPIIGKSLYYYETKTKKMLREAEEKAKSTIKNVPVIGNYTKYELSKETIEKLERIKELDETHVFNKPKSYYDMFKI